MKLSEHIRYSTWVRETDFVMNVFRTNRRWGLVDAGVPHLN